MPDVVSECRQRKAVVELLRIVDLLVNMLVGVLVDLVFHPWLDG